MFMLLYMLYVYTNPDIREQTKRLQCRIGVNRRKALLIIWIVLLNKFSFIILKV